MPYCKAALILLCLLQFVACKATSWPFGGGWEGGGGGGGRGGYAGCSEADCFLANPLNVITTTRTKQLSSILSPLRNSTPDEMTSAVGVSRSEAFELFRDSFSTILIERLSRPQKTARTRKRSKLVGAAVDQQQLPIEPGTKDAEDLIDFSDYVAALTFDSIPSELQTITYRTWAHSPALQEKYSLPVTSDDVSRHLLALLDPDVSESLAAYSIINPPGEDITTFLAPVLTAYLGVVTAPPPPAWTTRGKASECEMCGRDWVPLTYHHLIPRFVHAKAVKRGWHREEDLQNVAWLCRACHSFVHRFAGHEELAREYFTVERLLEREEVRSFAAWAGRVRWKAR